MDTQEETKNSELQADETKKQKPQVSNINTTSSCCFNLTTTSGQILFLLIAITIPSLLQWIPCNVIPNLLSSFTHTKSEIHLKRPIYYIYGENKNFIISHLKLIHLVLQGLGIMPDQDDNPKNWDLLWAHKYPFADQQLDLANIQPYQKVNHFPGNNQLSIKLLFATTENKYIPKSFQLPHEKAKLLEYGEKYPNKMFVQKNINHRSIYVRTLDEIDYNDNRTFVQEYISNPLLVDGRRFDFGVYVIITSIDPLRVYIYKGDVIFRHCPAEYYPFDAADLNKYIVADQYIPTWEMKSLSYYYNELGYGMKASFDAFMKSKGIDTEDIWFQVEDSIRSIILQKEGSLINNLYGYKSKHSFFEMMRFDLIIDNDLNVYLLEANMSPNLSPIKYNELENLFKQVLYNLFNLVGVSSPLERDSLNLRNHTIETMISSRRDIVVNPNICASSACKQSCFHKECALCLPCLTQETITDLHTAYREHVRRGDTKRIFPIPISEDQVLDEEILKKLSPKNQLMTRWFHGKCLLDSTWCS